MFHDICQTLFYSGKITTVCHRYLAKFFLLITKSIGKNDILLVDKNLSVTTNIYCLFRYVGLFIWLFGIVGNVLTILTLTSTKQFRSNTLSVFVIVISAINIFILAPHVGLIVLSTFLDFSPRSTYTSWCKVYAYIYYSSVYISIALLAVATIDRWLSTSRSVQLRSFSSIRNARIMIGSVILFFIFLLIPHPIYSEILFDPTRNSTKCDRPDGIYRIYVNYGLVIFVHAIPITIMIVFSYLTYRHLSTVNHNQRPRGITMKHRINIQMTRTLFIQIILFLIFIIPNWIITILYPTFIATIIQRSAERIAIEMLANNLSMLLYCGSFADTFYIFLIVAPTFRRNVKLLLRFQHGNNQVAPHLPNIQQ